MKIYFKYILGLLGVVMMSSCTEEKTYVIDSFSSGTVDFEIENIQLGDRSIARSVAVESGYYPVGYGATFDIPVYYAENPNESNYFTCSSVGENVVLSGGNNELRLKFTPRCPEETSAHFTTPWGKEYDLTAQDSVLNILINRDMLQQQMDYSLIANDYYVIKAESQYKKDDILYINTGYVMIQLINELEYVKSEGKWYYNAWMWSDNVMEIKGNCNFHAQNLSVGDVDSALTVWCDGSYYPKGYRDDYFSVPVYHVNDDGTKTYTGQTVDVNLNGENLLWAGMNNEIKFTFRPSDASETTSKLILPDGKVIYPTAQDSTYVWALPNDIVKIAGSNPIVVNTQSAYTTGGVRHINEGYLLIEVDEDIYYDKTDGTWARRQ